MALAKTTTPQNGRPNAVAPGTFPSNISAPNARTQNRNEQYQRAQVEMASPARLIVLLYDGAIRFCTQALEAMAQGLLERQNTNLIKAQNIVVELIASLKPEVGGEMAANLLRLYTHMREQLIEANLYDRKEPVEAVLKHLHELRETWVEVERLTAPGTTAQTTGAETFRDAPAIPIQPQEIATRALRLGNLRA